MPMTISSDSPKSLETFEISQNNIGNEDSVLGEGATMLNVVGIMDESDGWGDTGGEGQRAGDDLVAQRVARLTAGQLDCLRLVDQHLSSKEIASELKISSHTVDQRVRQALAILGVERRSQAARLVARHSGPYQRLIHQSPHIPGHVQTGHPEAAVGYQIRHADRAGGTGDAGFLTEQRPVSFRSSLQLPFATRSNPRNEMSVGQRLFWIATIAIGAAFSAGMYLAGLESLGRLLKS
ncbi:MAG TPA: helix-turn-helix transcriptional regulator [Sphingomicrobium sp.]|nr:helix-turn-helix transcriptional regulator [Sphingomicrobium sp.]